MYNKKGFINKKPKLNKNEYFSQIGIDSIHSAMKSLSGTAFKVYIELASQKDDFALSNKQISERTGINIREITTAYAELEIQGFIKYDKYKNIEVLYNIEAKKKVSANAIKEAIHKQNPDRKKRTNNKSKTKNTDNPPVKNEDIPPIKQCDNPQPIWDNPLHNIDSYKDNIDINIYAETSLEVSAYNDVSNSNTDIFYNSDYESINDIHDIYYDIPDEDNIKSQKKLIDMIDTGKKNILSNILSAYNLYTNSELKKFEYCRAEKRRINSMFEDNMIDESYHDYYLDLYKQNTR